MKPFRLTLRCANWAEVRALREQLDEDTVRVAVPEEAFLDVGSEVEVEIELPGGAKILVTGMCGSPGPAGVAVSIDPLSDDARDVLDAAAPPIDPPTRRNTGYGAEPETARVPRLEMPAAAFRDDHPRVVKREVTPPPPPPAPRPVVVVPPLTDFPSAPVRSNTPTVPAPTAGTDTAETLLEAGKLQQALVVFQRRAKASPHDQAAQVGVELVEGLLARDRGDRFEATQRFEAALAIDPDDPRAAAELTEIRRAVVEARLAGLTRLVDKKPT